MTTIATDLIEGSKTLADFDGTGDDPDDFISDAKWLLWVNQSIEALFKKICFWNPSFAQRWVDFTLAANESYAWLSDVRTFKGLTLDPTLPRKRTIHRYNAGARDRQWDRHYRVEGRRTHIEPARNAAGNYRMFYTWAPTKLVENPDPDVTVRAASAAELDVANPDALWFPSTIHPDIMTVSGGGGAGGCLLVDGVSIGLGGVSGDKILIRHGAAAIAAQITVAAVAVDPLPADLVFDIAEPGIPPATSLQVAGPHAVLVIDGYTVVSEGDTPPGDIILLAGQDDPIQNGLWRCNTNHALGGIHLQRVNSLDIGGDFDSAGFYNDAFATNCQRIAVTNGDVYGGATFRLTSGVGVDVAPLTFAPGIVPGKGLWQCNGQIEGGAFQFSRMAEALDAATVDAGLLVEASEGVVNADDIFSSFGDADTIGTWIVGTSDVSFDLVTSTDVLDEVFEPFTEWLMIRTAIRGLRKDESNETANALRIELADLTVEAQQYVMSQDSAESDTANDLSNERPYGDLDPGLWRNDS